MGPFPPNSRSRWRWPRSGWRFAAAINTVLVIVCAILLLALLAWSSSRSGGIKTNLIFFAGNCEESRTTNLWLHLLLNVFSTIILASSNFFCQVLSSPSRNEVDVSHAKGKSMLIGVPSFSNIFRVGKFKGYTWVLFFLSTIPLHLFFNSAIFQTEYQGGHWNLTLASEDFVNGAPYFNPGAMLLPGGMIEYPCSNCGGTIFSEYGEKLQLEDYFDPESPVSNEIAVTSTAAKRWKRLEVPECRSQYDFCSARVKYGNVVMVVESQDPNFMYNNDTGLGWTKDSVLEPPDKINTKYWDSRVPAADSNSLWYFANCNTTADLSAITHQAEGCFQTCNRVIGKTGRGSEILSADEIEPTYSFDFITGDPGDIKSTNVYWPGLKDRSASRLELKYCLAEEIYPICKVGLSNELLLAVLVCVCVKAALCATVTIVLGREDPLVVPGDAIVSFMTRPDAMTVGRCTLDRSHRHKNGEPGDKEFQIVAGASQWHLNEGRRWYCALPAMVWVRSYFLFVSVVILLVFVFRAAQVHNPYNDGKQSLAHSATNGILDTEGSGSDDLLRSVLTANLPQLLLSFSYYVYNSIYTRLCAEKEWNAYSTDYRPLRVTDPKGQQVSSYRLQLPYRYSVPLISISALLHFLVSNTLYVFILEGGYYMIESPTSWSFQGMLPPPVPGSGLSFDAYVGIGYSSVAILVVLILAVVLPVVPFVLCWFKVKGSMVLGGSDSMVISAACHIAPIPEDALGTTATAAPATPQSPLWRTNKRRSGYQQVAPRDPAQVEGGAGQDSPTDRSAYEMQLFLESDTSYDRYRSNSSDQKALVPSEMGVDDLEIDGYVVVDISRGLVRWGAVKAPAPDYIPTGDPVGHLGFGCKEHEVEDPIEAHWYM